MSRRPKLNCLAESQQYLGANSCDHTLAAFYKIIGYFIGYRMKNFFHY